MGVYLRIVSLLLPFVLLYLAGHDTNAQASLNKSVDFKGVINSQVWGNSSSGIARRSDPFIYRLNGNLVFNAWGWKTSAAFHISTSRKAYSVQYPDVKIPGFALMGISPEYRWLKLHLGNRHMHFSDYSFSNHSFFGGGVELSPGNFRLAAFYGRLKRENASNIGLRQSLDPAFRRMGWGVKVGIEENENYAFISLFHASDKNNRIILEPENQHIYPQENMVASVTAGKKIGERIKVDLDYAWSALTKNIHSGDLLDESFKGFNSFFGLFKPLQSSTFRKALKTKLSFSLEKGTLHLMHERVDPGYQSLGALFFNNDYENFTGGSMLGMLDNKISLSINSGFQRNNLSGKESNSYTRFVGMINAQLRISKNSNLSVSFSNFATTNVLYATSIPIIQVDSINLSLVNRQYSIAYFKTFGSDNRSTLNGSVTYFRSKAIQNDIVVQDQTNRNFMFNFSGSFSLSQFGLFLNTGVMGNRNNNESTTLLTISPFLGASRRFINGDLLLGAHFSLVNMYADNSFQRRVLQPRISMVYKVFKGQELEFLSFLTHQQSPLSSIDAFTEASFRLSWKIRL